MQNITDRSGCTDRRTRPLSLGHTGRRRGAASAGRRFCRTPGFTCTRVDRGGVANLFARWGDKGHARSFGFNGHTDVVPVGDACRLDLPIPSAAEIKDGMLWGRGATDMKSGVAAFAAAAVDFVRDTPPDGAVDSCDNRR